MGINSTEVSYNFGQLGSMFIHGSGDKKPPTGMVFVAITFLTDTEFDSTSGLVADNDAANGLEYIGTDVAAHDLGAGAATAVSGEGGVAINSGGNTHIFPKGVTIYGRWTEIDVNSTSTLIAYLGQ